MGKIYDEIDEKLGAWLEHQHLFFVATAPLAEDGHVNVSPKGDLRWFRILGPRDVGFDLVQVTLQTQNGKTTGAVHPFLSPIARPTDLHYAGHGKIYICEFWRQIHNDGNELPGRILELSTVK